MEIREKAYIDEIDRTIQVRSGGKTQLNTGAFSLRVGYLIDRNYFVNVVNTEETSNKLVHFSCTNSNGPLFYVLSIYFRVYRQQ